MPKDKHIITRKNHKCGYCRTEIPKGSSARFVSERLPLWGENDNQIGIWYYKDWFCMDRDECERRFEEKNEHAKQSL